MQLPKDVPFEYFEDAGDDVAERERREALWSQFEDMKAAVRPAVLQAILSAKPVNDEQDQKAISGSRLLLKWKDGKTHVG